MSNNKKMKKFIVLLIYDLKTNKILTFNNLNKTNKRMFYEN